MRTLRDRKPLEFSQRSPRASRFKIEKKRPLRPRTGRHYTVEFGGLLIDPPCASAVCRASHSRTGWSNFRYVEVDPERVRLRTAPSLPVREFGRGGVFSMATGTVKWFNDSKGYGFITPDEGGKDLFIHHSNIAGDGFKSLSEGAKVVFEQRQGAKGAEAFDVSPASASVS